MVVSIFSTSVDFCNLATAVLVAEAPLDEA